MEKPRALILFAIKHRWEESLIAPLERLFHVETVYLRDKIRLLGMKACIKAVNEQIASDDIQVAFFNVDFFPFVDFTFIRKIQVNYKWMFSGDDPTHHLHNSITALHAGVDGVIVSDPVSRLKYKSLGISSLFLPLEGGTIYKQGPPGTKKQIDVLFIGSSQKADRQVFLDALTKDGINVRVEGGETSSLTYEAMVGLLQRAKIVLNFSKNTVIKTQSIEPLIYDYLLEWKGRILEAGLCGSLCVSEYAPSLELVFLEGEIPFFRSPQDCVAVVRQLLADPSLLASTTDKFVARCKQLNPNNLIGHFELSKPPGQASARGGEVPYRYYEQSFRRRFHMALDYRKMGDFIYQCGELANIKAPASTKALLLGTVCIMVVKTFVSKLVAAVVGRL